MFFFHAHHTFYHMQGTVLACVLYHNTCNFPPFWILGASLSHFSVFCLTVSNFLASFMFGVMFCALHASTLCANISKCSLVASSMSSYVATSLTLLSIIPSSLSQPMNCSVSSLSYSLNSHSAALVCSLPIHLWADSLLFLCNVQYCSSIIILSCCGLNLLLNTNKRPFVVLHFSSSWVNICISCRTSQTNYFFNYWDLFLLSSYTLAFRMFMTSITKFINVTYLS